MGKLCMTLLAAGVLAMEGSALAASLDLSRYRVSSTIKLPAAAAAEASAVTYNWDNGNLFVLGDEGDALAQYTRAGVLVNTMTLSGFDDTEGLAYIGGGKFVLTEERLRDAYRLTYTAGGSAARAALPSVDLGTTVGNIGIEGISFDRASGDYLTVKEVANQEVKQWSLDFSAGTAVATDLFAANLGVLDLADIQVLSAVTSLQGTAGADNLLIISQASAKLMEVTRAGMLVSAFDLSSHSLNAEGVTIDPSGTIYIVGETSLAFGDMSTLFVLAPVPEPETYAMLLAGLGLLGWRLRRGRVKTWNGF